MRRPRTRRFAAAATAVILFGLAWTAGATGLLDPLLRFRQTRTAHFVIYFHQGEEHLAARLAALVEPARDAVALALGVEPPAMTHVILADQSEQANGWATPLPRNLIFLNAAAPSGAELIGRTDDWLRLVFTHEYTHIVHLDRSHGWARVVRGLFGRNAIAFPNMWLPQWQIEGLATFEESAITGGGRRDAGDFRAIERIAAAAGQPLTLDRASGGLVRWPDGHAAYSAGLGFHEYLADRFGAASLGQLATATSRRLPFLGTRAFRGVYGQSLGSLWRDYSADVRAAGEALVRVPASPVTQLTFTGYLVAGPRFAGPACAGCEWEIVYSSQNPDGFPALRAISGPTDRRLTTRYQGATAGITDRFIVFDQQEIRRNVGVYASLFAFDRGSERVRAIGGSERLQDPDVSPDGTMIVAVRGRGGARDLVIGNLAGSPQPSLMSVTSLASADDTQYSAPRWSPDGRLIAVERRRLGALPEVVVFDVPSRSVHQVWADPSARIVTPAWRPDGRGIVAAADFQGRPFDLYEFDLDTPGLATRLTSTNGAIWPDVSSDGRTIVFSGYTARGYDVFSTPYAAISGDPPLRLLPSRDAPYGAGVPAASSSAYSPLATLVPTFWTPYAVVDSDQTRIGGAISGTDVLGRHGYGLSASWLVSGPEVIRPLNSTVPDWRVSYAYARWRPTLFSSASRQTVFALDEGTGAPGPREVVGIDREIEAGVYLPLLHVRRRAQMLASVARRTTTYDLARGERTRRLVSTRLAFAHDTSQRYGYSVSQEHGLNAGVTLEMARRALGSAGNATTATLDARAYLPALGRHHVLALRAAGGLSRGDESARQTFRLGAFAASPSVVDFNSAALGLMRGGLEESRSGDRLVVGNVEYRLPLGIVERGYGTLPLLLRTLHASVFADVAQVRGGTAAGGLWTSAAGGELSVDAVAGYGLPFAATVGVSWGRDGNQTRGAQVYARLGRSF